MPIWLAEIFPISLKLSVVKSVLEPASFRCIEQKHGPVQRQVVVEADHRLECAGEGRDPHQVRCDIGMLWVYGVHRIYQGCPHFRICRRDASGRGPQCHIDLLGIPACEQDMLKICGADLRKYRSSRWEQPLRVSNAMQRRIAELVMQCDARAISQEQRLPSGLPKTLPRIDIDHFHGCLRAKPASAENDGRLTRERYPPWFQGTCVGSGRSPRPRTSPLASDRNPVHDQS